MKNEARTIDVIMKSLRVEYLAPSNVLIRSWHESDTYMRRSVSAINQYFGGTQIFQNKGEKECQVANGDAVLIRAGRFYRAVKCDMKNTRRRGISFRFSIMGGYDPLEFLDTPFVLSRERGDYFTALSKELFASEKDGNFLGRAVSVASVGMKLLQKIIEISVLKKDALDKLEHYSRLSAVFEYISQNIDRDMPVEMLASMAKLSASRFFYVFQQATGFSPNQYVLQKRIERAQELLPGDLSITEISKMTGFSDQFYFSRMFKSKTGCTPSDFRRKMKSPDSHFL